MEYITLKNSELRVSRLCMGGCPMGGYGWGEVQKQELVDAVHTALAQGINFFDTADTYGLGTSERTLAEALGSERSRVVIATKFGVRVENGKTFYDNSPEWIRTACENSLRRLGTDYIDVYQVHYRDGRTPIGAVLDALEELRKAGKVRYFGLSNLTRADLPELQAYTGRFVSVQNQYSLASRELEDDTMELCRALGMTPLTWGSLGQGVLTGKYDRNAVFGANDRRSREIYVNFHGEKLLRNLELVERMKPIAAAHGKPLSAVAVRFILDHIPDSAVLCGIKRPAQVLDNAEAMGWRLTQAELQELDAASR